MTSQAQGGVTDKCGSFGWRIERKCVRESSWGSEDFPQAKEENLYCVVMKKQAQREEKFEKNPKHKSAHQGQYVPQYRLLSVTISFYGYLRHNEIGDSEYWL
jgi:hypothetical protein